MASDADSKLGKYQLKSRLGQGGMGIVYLATDTRLKRDVALKLLPKEMASDEATVKRFLREARAAARLNHPNVVAVYDVDQQRGDCYLVMELVNGCTASELLAQGPLSWSEATRLIAEACRGLAAAHEAGLVHRDIKPSNIMRTHDGLVKLADFGLAKAAEDSEHAKNPLTQSGTILGTPQYMSPEQCRGEPIDARSDLYSLGATYFTLLTGQAPFEDASPLQVMFAHCSKPTPDPRDRQADLPPGCSAIVMKSMAKSRVERFGSAKEMLTALTELLAAAPQQELATSPVNVACVSANSVSATTSPATVVPALNGERTALFDDATRTSVIVAPKRMASEQRRVIALSIVSVVMLVACAALWNWPPSSNSKPGNHNAGDPSSDSRADSTPQEPIAASATALKLLIDFPEIRSEVRGVAFAHDSKSVFTASRDGSVRQWSLADPKLAREWLSSEKPMQAVAASRDWLAAGGDDRTLWLWSLKSERPPIKLAELSHELQSLAISPNGERLAVGTAGSVELFELTERGGKRLLQVATADDRAEFVARQVYCVAFSSDSRWLAATSWEKRIAVWNANDGSLREVRKEQAHELMSVGFVPEQERLIFGASYDAGLFVWDFKTPNSEIRPLRSSHGRSARSFAVTPHSVAFVNGEWGGLIRVYDVNRDTLLGTAQQSTSAGATDLAMSRDGRLLATCGGEKSKAQGYLQVWGIVPTEEK